jgi:hypothetical protein
MRIQNLCIWTEHSMVKVCSHMAQIHSIRLKSVIESTEDTKDSTNWKNGFKRVNASAY